MEDAYILCYVTEFFSRRKMTKTEKRRHWHNSVKTHQLICVNIQILQLLKGRIDQWGVGHDNPFFFA
jgi:hypothetical protein